MAKHLLGRLRGRLIVSCQAYPSEPLNEPSTMEQMARAAIAGGAAGIRAQGLAEVGLISASTDVPLIGLWKDGADPVFITPTLAHAKSVADAGADIVALDGTRRPRPDKLTLAQTIAELRKHADVLTMADCGSLSDAQAAQDAGADLIGTTLAGYSGERKKTEGPDVELIDQLVSRCQLPVIVEGRVHTPAQAADAIARGAFAVVVGTAITHPTTITSWFSQPLSHEYERLTTHEDK